MESKTPMTIEETILRKHASEYFNREAAGDFILDHKVILAAMREFRTALIGEMEGLPTHGQIKDFCDKNDYSQKPLITVAPMVFQFVLEKASLALAAKEEKHKREMEEFQQWLYENGWIYSMRNDGTFVKSIPSIGTDIYKHISDLLTQFRNRSQP